MSKVAIVYWSGTGNTAAMAEFVRDGAVAAGAEAELIEAIAFGASNMDEYDAFAFGCPSMGAEELEETTFAPMFEEIESKLNGKKVVLFGSYGWGDGQWMRDWEDRVRNDGAVLAAESVICNYTPTDATECNNLGKALV